MYPFKMILIGFIALTAVISANNEFTSFVPAPNSPPSFTDPRGIIANDDGTFYVLTSNNIKKVDSEGRLLLEWGDGFGTSDTQFHNPFGIAKDSNENVYVADTGNHCIKKFDSNGTFLFKFGEEGEGDGQFKTAIALVIDPSNDDVYILDQTNSKVQIFNAQGSFISSWGEKGDVDGELKSPKGLTFDSNGHILITSNYWVQEYKKDGTFLLRWDTGNRMYRPRAITVDVDGYVYVVDEGYYHVYKFDSAGNYISSFGSYDDQASKKDGEFYNPKGIAIDASGKIYVTDDYYTNRIQIFTADGKFIKIWTSHGQDIAKKDGKFDKPYDIAIDSKGNIFVAEYGNSRIQKFDKDGNFLFKWGSYGSFSWGTFIGIEGIAIDKHDNVYTIESGNNRVQKFDNNGTFIKWWGSEGYDDGEFRSPKGIAVDENDFVYIADQYNNRIQKFDSNGTFVLKWKPTGGASDVASDKYGNIYVLDGLNPYMTPKDETYINQFDSNGTFIKQWGKNIDNDGHLYKPRKIEIDNYGFVYVSDSAAGQFLGSSNYNNIHMYSSNGTHVKSWGSGGNGNANGQFYLPQGMAFDKNNALYVADTWNHRIQNIGLFSKNYYFKQGSTDYIYGTPELSPGIWLPPFQENERLIQGTNTYNPIPLPVESPGIWLPPRPTCPNGQYPIQGTDNQCE